MPEVGKVAKTSFQVLLVVKVKSSHAENYLSKNKKGKKVPQVLST